MADDLEAAGAPTEIFKALGDPIRWSIVTQMAAVGELACLALEDTLPVSKPTISYHTKILYQVGLISVRKEGRNYFYSLRRDVLQDVLDGLWELTPKPRPVVGERTAYLPSGTRQHLVDPGRTPSSRKQRLRDRDEIAEEVVVLTW